MLWEIQKRPLQLVEVVFEISGASDRTWTDTRSPSRDFKSLVSADSTTLACYKVFSFLEAAPRFELGIKVLQTSALPLGYAAIIWSGKRDSNSRPSPWQGDALPLSYSRIWCLRAESNRRHEDFQSSALPTELPRHLATPMGFEPTLSAVTGRHVNRYTTGPTT